MKPIVIKLILIIPMILLSVFIFNQIPKLDNIFIKVTDESGNVVWESDDEFDFEEYEEDYLYNDDKYFSI